MAARLHHEVTGPEDAPVVLVGSALGATHAMWSSQVDVLSQRFRVVAFDHRGHGQSEVPAGPYTIDDLGNDVVGLLDSLDVPQASYVGLSLGGSVGLWLAENAGDRFHRFALLCPPVNPSVAADTWAERAATVRAEGTQAITDATLGRWFLPEFAEKHPDVVATIRQQLLDCPDEGYAACCEALGSTDLTPGLESITAPVLVVGAEQDPSVPPETLVDAAHMIPGVRFEIIENAAHLIPVTHAAEVNQLLLDHLAS